MSYYKNNSDLLFRRRGAFDQMMTLDNIEDMIPFEREVYLIQIAHKVEAYNQEQANKKS